MNENQKEKIKELCIQNGVEYLGLFGSFARGDCHENSDVDLLAKYLQPLSLLEKGRLINNLTDVLGRDVDLVSYKSLKPALKHSVEKDLQVIYEKR
ncbi:MAG: DNA polymerase beta subunit [uncultured bacterium]|nr:MAG: DNA polymerase beta subunit [uncultured bacterium]